LFSNRDDDYDDDGDDDDDDDDDDDVSTSCFCFSFSKITTFLSERYNPSLPLRWVPLCSSAVPHYLP